MDVLYSQNEARKMKKRADAARIGAWGVLLAALAVCIFLCTRVRTGNADRLLYTVIGLFTLAGWAFILILSLAARPCAAEYRHMAGILGEETEETEGRLKVSSAVFQIPGSVQIRKATLEGKEKTIALNVDARLARRLPPNGSMVRVRTVRKFIVGAEVCDEKAE